MPKGFIDSLLTVLLKIVLAIAFAVGLFLAIWLLSPFMPFVP